jgi:hypothetical protein
VFKREVVEYPGGATVDGIHGDHILIAPPYTVRECQLEEIVTELKDAYDSEGRNLDKY